MLSVICPTYNRADRIQNAIRSIIDQTYTDWELIIVDDGSTDHTQRIVRDFAHPHIKYFPIPHQNNISKVRNIGADLAKGEIIVVQDSDDLSFPDRLEEIHKCFESTAADVVYHGVYLRNLDPYTNAVTRSVRPAQPFDKGKLLREQYIPGQFAYTKQVWSEIKYNEEIPLCDDYMFLIELALNNKQFVALDKNLYEYVFSIDSISMVGEADGRRKKDAATILSILKRKYNIEGKAILTKSWVNGKVTEEVIEEMVGHI